MASPDMNRNNPLDSALRLLEGLKPYPPPRSRFDDLRRTAKDVPLSAARFPGKTTEQAVSRAAYLFWQIALTAKHRDLIDICFDFWMRIGPLGWVLAVRYLLLDTTDEQVVEQTMGNLFARDQLLLLNQIVKIRRTSNSPAMIRAKALLADPSTRRNQDKQAFVLTLKRRGTALSRVLREVLIREGFSIRLGKRIASSAMEEDGIAAAEAAGFFQDRAFDAALAKTLQTGSPALKIAVLQAARAAGTGRRPALVREIVNIIRQPDDPSMSIHALETLIVMRQPGIENPFMRVLSDLPDRKDDILRRALLLNGEQYAAVSERLSPSDREHADRLMMRVLLDADPEWVMLFIADYIEKVPRRYAMEQRSLDDIRRFLTEYRSRKLTVSEIEAPAPVLNPEQENTEEPAPLDLGSRLGSMLKFKMEPETARRPGRNDFFGNSAGKKVDSPSLSDVPVNNAVYRESTVTGGSFDNVVFTDCVFDDATFDNCWFNGCRFENCTFTNARFNETTVQWVFMKTCDFRKAVFQYSSLTGLVVSRSGFSSARFIETELAFSSTRETDFCGAVFERAAISTVRFNAANFSHAALISSKVSGTELRECVFKCMLTADSDLTASKTEACIFRDCLNINVRTESANMLLQMLGSRNDRICSVCDEPQSSEEAAWIGDPGCYEMLMQLVDAWFIRQDFTTREAVIRRCNRDRVEMGIESLARNQREFMTLLPVLLQSDLLGRDGPDTSSEDFPHPSPILKIAGYTPSFTAWELVQNCFNVFEIPDPGPEAPTVTAIMALPPYGSMLQTPLDAVRILICLEASPGLEKENSLKAGLSGLSEWAAEKYRMTVEFFMTHEEMLRASNTIRPASMNGSTEQSWTRDDLLFRTTLLAGRLPLWWAAPAGMDEAEYEEYLKQIRDMPLNMKNRFFDMGFPSAPSGKQAERLLPERVMDVFHSPLDAVMNLCLLLGKLDPEDGAFPSCRKLKRNLFSGRMNPAAVDHAALTVLAAQKSMEHPSAADVSNPVPLLFSMKAFRKGAENDLFSPGRAGANRFVEALCTKAGISEEAFNAAVKAGAAFSGMAGAGKLASVFITDGIRHLVEKERKNGFNRIDEKHLLGIKDRLEARLAIPAGEKGKSVVARIPFPAPMSRAFSRLEFRSEKKPGRPAVWILYGSRQAADREETVELRRDTDLARLVSWPAANGLYDASTVIDADHTASPVTPEDLSSLLELLSDLFPPDGNGRPMFASSRTRGLIAKVLFIVNLTAPREADSIFEASTVFTDGAGMMHCFTRQIFNKHLQNHPREYLQSEMPELSAGRAELFCFKPSKSRSPTIRL